MGMAYNNKSHSKVDNMAIDDLLLLKKDGKPDYGAVLEHFRIWTGWSREQLAFYYSEALGKEQEVTASWVYHMEKENRIPIDPKRRWILAQLLSIPPALLGLKNFENPVFNLFDWKPIDVQEYHLMLEKYNAGWHATTVFQEVADVQNRISNLYREAPHSLEQEKIYKLLCGYLLLLGDLAHSYMRFDTAVDHLSKAIAIAEEKQFYDLWAFALRQKGNVYEERGEITVGLHGHSAAKADFSQAMVQLQMARSLEKKVQPIFKGLVLSCVGTAYAATAQDQHEFDGALKILENATKMIGKTADDLPLIHARFDEERYHLNRATAYLARPSIHHAKLAQEELDQASKKSSGSFARKVFADTLLARSYLMAKNYCMATSYTDYALNTVIESTSLIHLTRLDIVYKTLKKTPYGNNSDVAVLGTKLLKAQQPELFN
jgi:tetratricopeptide (TPR) repeat protein